MPPHVRLIRARAFFFYRGAEGADHSRPDEAHRILDPACGMTSPRILVTGGAGFIGSHLAEAFCRRGARVVVLDNGAQGAVANLAWRRPGDALDFVEGDLADTALLGRLTRDCDWVFHQAAVPSVPLSVDRPWETHRNNADGTLALLIAARDAGVRRFVFASSSSIYGNVETDPKHEGLPPDPLSPYALQKYTAERYCQLFHRLYGLPTVALRYFNVFGPRQSFNSPYSGVIAKFCTAALRGERPMICGDGLQSRDFTYVANVVAGNLAVAEAAVERIAGRVFNVACGEGITLLQLVAELARLTGRPLNPEFTPARPGEVRHSRADITAAREAFGYQPAIPWTEGLARTLDFYRETQKAGQTAQATT